MITYKNKSKRVFVQMHFPQAWDAASKMTKSEVEQMISQDLHTAVKPLCRARRRPAFRLAHPTLPKEGRGQTRKTILPTICSSPTQPTVALRESTEVAL